MATIYPYYLMAKEITAGHAQVDLLYPSQVSPHFYKLKPADISRLDKGQLIIANGLGLDNKVLKNLHYNSSRLIIAADFVDIKSGNPHIWLDPVFLKDIVKGLAEKLGSLDTENEKIYFDNAQKIITELVELDKQITKERAQYNYVTAITLHDAFYYFARRYNLHIIPMEAFPGKNLSPGELANLLNIIKEQHIKALYIEPQINPAQAVVLANENHLDLFILNSLDTFTDNAHISDLLRDNWITLKKGFK
ncbi:MAG: metal ABC transporter substrate-binding protein [Candidatus Margulisbacteria bacterium]|nr:metal ABC transporter substrate-binding protein [Candidatus Margulisiibacteriota bacterium]